MNHISRHEIDDLFSDFISAIDRTSESENRRRLAKKNFEVSIWDRDDYWESANYLRILEKFEEEVLFLYEQSENLYHELMLVCHLHDDDQKKIFLQNEMEIKIKNYLMDKPWPKHLQ